MSLTKEQRDKIIARVRKLLALAGNNPNEAEAEAAMEKVQVMLAEYNLGMDEVEIEDKGEEFVIRQGDLARSVPWHKLLYQALAKLYYCRYSYGVAKRYGRSAAGKKYVDYYESHDLYGTEVNILVCREMAKYLIDTVNRLTKEAALKQPAVIRYRYSTSFANACVLRIVARIAERVRMAKNGDLKSGTRNLPAVVTTALDQFFEKAGVKQGLKDAKTRLPSLKQEDGAKHGWEAGEGVGLDIQVGGNRSNSEQISAAKG